MEAFVDELWARIELMQTLPRSPLLSIRTKDQGKAYCALHDHDRVSAHESCVTSGVTSAISRFLT